MELPDRLFFRLRDALAREMPGAAAGAPFTVADLYQRLVPYRAVRAELGILELAQYEHALLRLLAGERGHLEVESETAREEIRRELASPNPILGLYRDYAGVTLRLGSPGGVAPADPPAAREADAPPATPEPPPPPLAAAPPPHVPPLTPTPAPERECRRCSEPLPAGEEVRFCPACGAAQREAPCRSCGAGVRPEWNFCVRCGTARPE